jgi:hypothetical protein
MTASLRNKAYDSRLGVRGRSDPHPKSRTRNAPIVKTPVSPAVGNGMFTLCGNRQPVLWSTEMNFFCTASWMQRRLTRNALAAKGRAGPTAGETGPRCGRTCGATRQQRNDDSLRISNHALKKGGPSAKCSAFASATGPDLHWANGLGKSVFKSWRNRGPATTRPSADGGEWAALPPISCAPRD